MKQRLRQAAALVQHYLELDMLVYAGHATLFLLTAFFPLLMWLLVAVNSLPIFSAEDIARLLFEFLPDVPQIQDTVRDLIASMSENSTTFVASFAVIITLWSASSGMAAIQKGLQKLTPGSHRTMLDRLWALVYTLVFFWMLLLVTFLQSLRPLLVWLINLMPLLSQSRLVLWLRGLLSFGKLVGFGISVPLFALIYTYVPGGRRKFRDQLPGALFAGAGWFVFSEIFTYYIRNVWQLSYIYGSLAAIIVLILWLNVNINLLFLGAGLNAARDEKKTPQ